jgi:hypothetical protein
MAATIVNGWLVVPYGGTDFSKVFMAMAQQPEGVDWKPAYLDYEGGQRVAKIRPPQTEGRALRVWLKVDGHVTDMGGI